MDTKDDTKIASPITFHPMPKRFMVWDDEAIDWICVPGTERDVWDLVDLFTHKTGLMRHKFHMKIVQSTNLFDKDGKEIFEGSIVKWGVDTGLVEFYNGKWTFHVVDDCFDVYHELCPNVDLVETIGHILSNPELLEEK